MAALQFFNAVNDGDHQLITKIVSAKAPELAKSIQKRVGKGFNFLFTLKANQVEFFGNSKVKTPGTFKASGTNWNMEDFSMDITLEKQGDEWFIVDTNFPLKLSSLYFWGFLLLVFSLVISVLGFWLWMLVDCIKNPVPYKPLWILLLVLFNLVAMIPYYFIVKRRRKE